MKRLMWKVFGLADLLVSAPIYLLVPRHVRNFWMMPGTVMRNQRACDEVRAVIDGAPHARVLDVGGGIAALSESLSAGGAVRVITLDLDMEMLLRARGKIPGAVLLCADGTRLPFADRTFDAVVMVHALEHIPEPIRDKLASEIKRVTKSGVVIHGPAGADAVTLTRRFIDRMEARGMEVPRYAREHLEFSMPMPGWFATAFPGCRVQPHRNLDVELVNLLTAYTPVLRWLGGYRQRRMAARDQQPPFVEYTMTWRKAP